VSSVSAEQVFEHVQLVPVTQERAFAFFSEPENLARLTPGWTGFRIVEAPSRLERGARIRYRLGCLGIGVDWVAEIVEWRPPQGFADVQVSGPYASWAHEHTLVPVAGGTEVRDRISYRLPGGRLGPLADRLGHRALLRRLFAYRARRLNELLA
jgi:ligand-binding SRPBCC domain-containing protein